MDVVPYISSTKEYDGTGKLIHSSVDEYMIIGDDEATGVKINLPLKDTKDNVLIQIADLEKAVVENANDGYYITNGKYIPIKI